MALKMFVDAQRPANDGVSRCPMQPGDDLPQVPSIDGSIRWCPNKAHQSWTHKASMTKGYWKPARRMALVEALWFFLSLVEIMFEGDPGPTAAQENTTTMFPFLFMLRRLPWAQAKIEASFKRGVLVKHCVLWSWLRFHKSFLLPSNPELQALTVLKFARCWQADPLWVDARQCTPIWKLARGANDPMQAAFSLPPAATDWLVSCCHKRSYVGSNALCVMKALRPLWRTVLCEVARAGCSRCFYAPCTWHHMFHATHRNILLTGFDWQCTVRAFLSAAICHIFFVLRAKHFRQEMPWWIPGKKTDCSTSSTWL